MSDTRPPVRKERRKVAPGEKLRGADKVRMIPVINADSDTPASERGIQRKPDWIRVRVPAHGESPRIMTTLRKHKPHTVCEEAACPTLTACFGAGTAPFMI